MTSAYIETTIPSFYYTARTDAQSLARMKWTREWWDTFSDQFSLYSSAAVIVELDRGTRESEKNQRVRLIDGLELLEITSEVRDVARMYVERLVMPQDAAGDALHLALASFYGVDVLLTWNCKHLANPNKFDHIHKINHELHLSVPLMTTPLNYLSEDNSDAE
jgi:predicted nucleic acid-binding protein